MRLTMEERKYLRLLEAALQVGQLALYSPEESALPLSLPPLLPSLRLSLSEPEDDGDDGAMD